MMNTSNRKYVIDLLLILFIIGACEQNQLKERSNAQTSEKGNLSYSFKDGVKTVTLDFGLDSISISNVRKHDKKDNKLKVSVENNLNDKLKINELKFLIETNILIDPLLNSFYVSVLLKEEFASRNYTLKLLDTAGGATTFVLKDLKGRELKVIGAVPYKMIKFPIIDKNLQYIAYATSFEDGVEIRFLEVTTGNIISLIDYLNS